MLAIKCDECNGSGFLYFGSDEEYDVMACDCADTPQFLMIGEME